MIVRIFQVTVHEGKEAAFAEFFTKTAQPFVQSQRGIVSITVGLPRPETPREFCMVMVWQDVDSIRAFAGEDWREPHIHPDEAGMIQHRTLHHYEMAGA